MKKPVIIALSALLCISVLLNIHQYARDREYRQQTTDTTTYVDTIAYYKPVVRDSLVVRYVTAHLPLSQSDTLQHPSEFIYDSVNVVVPIVQKEYSDSTFHAWVSGYGPQLDSIKVYRQTQVVTNTIKEKSERWSIGLTTGYGIGKNGLTPYIGIGITYRLFSFGK